MSSSYKLCHRCGTSFHCNSENIQSCQCNIVLATNTLAFLKKTTYDCLCVTCLNDLNQLVPMAENTNIHDLVFEEGVHYYIENDHWVYTELTHIIRGYCCKSDCRHCAFGFKL